VTTREIVEHGPVVAMVPLHEDGTVTLVRQYRHATGSVLLEIPAGGIDAGETPEEAVRRELAEETGLHAGKVEPLYSFYPTAGFCTEFMHLYLVTELTEGPQRPADDEAIEVVRLPLEDALARVDSGEIRDAKSLIGLLALARRLQRR
jgi:ADP-ribose pyrophosphatase